MADMAEQTREQTIAAHTAVLEALEDFKVPRRIQKIDDGPTLSYEESFGDDEGEIDDEKTARSSIQKSKQKSKQLLRLKKLMEEEEERNSERQDEDLTQDEQELPWWAQKRKELEHNAQQQQSPIENMIHMTELKENLKYYSNLGQRSNIVLLLSIVTVIHTLYWYRYLPDETQICLRETESGAWWCSVGEAAERLISEYSKGQGLSPKKAFPTSNRTWLLMKTLVMTFGMNAIIVGVLQILPFLLKKESIAPPEWIVLQDRPQQLLNATKVEDIVESSHIVDTRRISLMSTFGYWLGCNGVFVNILLIAVNHTTYVAIHITDVASKKNEVYDNVGQGVDETDLMHYYIAFIFSFLVATGVLVYRFVSIHRHHQLESFRVKNKTMMAVKKRQ
jgi:hypothetical protein